MSPPLPRSFFDFTTVSVPLDNGLLFGQFAGELCVFKLGDGLIFELCHEVCRRLADDQLGRALVIADEGGVLALVIHDAVFDCQGVLQSIHPVDQALAERHLLAGLHPAHRHLLAIHLANEADGFLLLGLDVLDGVQELQLLLWKIM